MKKLVVLAIIFFLLLVSACAHKPCCPKEDSVIVVLTPFGNMPVKIEKDMFNEGNHGKAWMTLEELQGQARQPEKKPL